MALRRANSTTTTLDLGDGDSLTVISDISKRDFNNLIAAMPQVVDDSKGLTPVQGTQFQQALFETLVKGWSADVPASVEEYLALDQASAARVDEALVEHFGKLTPDAPKESKPKTSRATSPKD